MTEWMDFLYRVKNKRLMKKTGKPVLAASILSADFSILEKRQRY